MNIRQLLASSLIGYCTLAGFPSQAAADITGLTGGGLPYDNLQPSLSLTNVIQPYGIYPSRDGYNSADEPYMGSIRTLAMSFAPGGYGTNGQLLPIAQNTALFSLLGTNYGGNGVNTFALPNLQGRTMIGRGSLYPGESFGQSQTTLLAAQLPAHAHTLPGSADMTASNGLGQAIDNRQPSLAVSYMINTGGAFPSRSGGMTIEPFLGQVSAFAGNFAPSGYMLASGQVLPIQQYSALFSILGTTYGGNGVNTFALPDLNGKTIIGAGQGNALPDYALGQQVGTNTFTLTQNQMSAHSHTAESSTGATGITGGNQPFSNLQSSIALNYLIATDGIYPSLDRPITSSTVLGEISAFAGNFAPGGWAFADGRLLAIDQNEALFSLLGTTYGGDGQTTFALPDLRGRTIIGASADRPTGTYAGSESVRLTVLNLPPHVHEYTAPVPEPAPFALMLSGAGLLGFVMRRRQWKQS